ncbi:type I glutamate--ammonia ligase [Paenibacillus cremeus]|uniref:Glutamine synthetase n=1 Tax=Paenibacillus cremeus TaxID=2163881 RepID=A0A559KGB9_9BACL|nr:type I glutamate--ammonia ligase [Paenibacillus cremeus]TVY11148.1 type I glutamate--ammonia ligase [Paenibacillus cremeus]
MTITRNLHAELEKRESIKLKVREHHIDFIRLQFTDLFGFAKNMTIHTDELDKALNGQLMFDGSSIDGFASVAESDMYLRPDLDTFQVYSWKPNEAGVAHVYCDIYDADGHPFEGCPRHTLKRALREAELLGYQLNVGVEGEFFLFHMDDKGEPVFRIQDHAGYFALSPDDRGEEARQEIITTMKKLGYSIEASHHEVAYGQHEIDFKYDEALSCADKWMTFKQIVKSIAHKHGLYASFIPKPFARQNGNAMHCNQSLQDRYGHNAFYDPNQPSKLSTITKHYIGGLLKYAKEIAAIANPTVNSYKRLLPGYEAPTNIAWSCSNRSALIRIPHSRGRGTRIELRCPDPTANIYHVFAVMLRAGLEGIKQQIEPPAEVMGNTYRMTTEEKERLHMETYPRDLHTALQHMKDSPLVEQTLGPHAYQTFLEAKQQEADEYAEAVHRWEIERYLKRH